MHFKKVKLILALAFVLLLLPTNIAYSTEDEKANKDCPQIVTNDVFDKMYELKIKLTKPINLSNCQNVPQDLLKYVKLISSGTRSSLTMGSDCTYLNSDCGNDGVEVWSGSVNDGTYLHNWGNDQQWVGDVLYNGWADAKTYLISTLGSGDQFEGAAWAWVGNSFFVQGNQSQMNCRVSFYGDYYGSVSQLSDANALGSIMLQIYDLTASEMLIAGAINNTPSGSINHYADVTLKKDHNYVFMFIVWTEGHVDDPAPSYVASSAISDYWSNGLQGRGIDKFGLKFDWTPYQ